MDEPFALHGEFLTDERTKHYDVSNIHIASMKISSELIVSKVVPNREYYSATTIK